MTLENTQINFADGYSGPIYLDHESETFIDGVPFNDAEQILEEEK